MYFSASRKKLGDHGGIDGKHEYKIMSASILTGALLLSKYAGFESGDRLL